MSFAASSERPRRRIKVRARRPPPEAPRLARLCTDALPAPNMFARIYLYEWLTRFEDVDALGWPRRRLDAVHCWDAYLALKLLQRLAMHLAGLTELDAGQPAAGFARLVRALRRHAHDVDAPAPWAAADALLARAAVPPCTLAEVDLDLPSWTRPNPRAPEPVLPRRTRSMSRLAHAVAALDDEEEAEAPADGTRRSRRAEQLAVKKRNEDLRQRAERVLGAAQEEDDDEEEDGAEPMHLEAKIACLVRLCDLLSTPRGTPASSGLHRLVQPLVDELPAQEKRARDASAHVQAECDAAAKAVQKRAPSMVSARYEAWQHEVRRPLTQRKELGAANEHAVQGAHAEQYVALKRSSPRGGPLGRDLDGNEYWHLCPLVAPHGEHDACVGSALPGFSGHWSQVLVVYGTPPGGELGGAAGDATAPEADADADAGGAAPADADVPRKRRRAGDGAGDAAFFGTCDAAAIGALHAYLHHRMERAELSEEAAAAQGALLSALAQVQTYMAWAAAEVPSR